jgi:hypothetical protein
MDSKLVYFNTLDIFSTDKRVKNEEWMSRTDVNLFSKLFKLFSANVPIIDRTYTIETPIKSHLLPFLTIPKTILQLNDYDTVAMMRAGKLIQQANKSRKKLVLMYSGGIDSTAMMVSILRAMPVNQHNQLIVLLNDYSINENPNFYWNHLRNKVTIDSSHNFTSYLGNDNYIFITAEGNDQLFGSAVTHKYILSGGENVMHMSCDKQTMLKLIHEAMPDTKDRIVEQLLQRLDSVAHKAPVPIVTVFHWFWWMNFALKYQCVYTRMASFTHKKYRQSLRFEYNYTAFFTSLEFQCWSLNNSDKLIGKTWNSYKYQCKDFIFDFDKNLVYNEKKVKQGSLAKAILQKNSAKLISINTDGTLNFFDTLPPVDTIYNQENDFV